jgi:predicted Zn finger-like uncharacterized protein
MDVICERCATEYEFDDALLSERGTTVKCTSCGHQFKIYRPSKATPEELTRTWNLRRPDGTVIPFDSLAVLQKWIMEGRVSKMDEICRPGETWKALGAIAELDSFFVTAESRNAQVAPRASNRPPANKGSLAPGSLGPLRAATPAKATLPGGTPIPPPATKGSLPPMGVQPMRAPTPPLGSLSPAKSSLPPGSTSPVRAPTPPGLRAPAPKTPSVRPPTPLGSLRQGPPAPPPAPPAPAAPAGSATPSGNALRAASGGLQIPPPPRLPADLPGVPALAADPAPPRLAPPEPAIERRREMAIGPPPRMELDEIGPRAPRNVRDDLPADEDATQSATPESLGLVPPRRRGVGVAVGVTLGLVVALGVGFAAFRSGLFDGQSAPRAEAVNVGPQRDAVLRHARAYSRQGFEDARVELAQALALSPDHPQLLALRASLDAAAAEMLRAQADDLDQQARAPGAGAEAEALRAQAVSLRRDADERLPRARADAQAAARAPTPRAEADRVELAALLGDVARITGDAEAAQRHAETVRASQPRSVEADLFLGLLARDAGNHAEAATALRSVLARSPGHPRATLSLARVLVAQGDVLAARAELDGLLRASPGHEAATALSQARAAADAVAAAPAGTEPPAAPAQPPAAPAQPAVAAAQPPAAPAQPLAAPTQPAAPAQPPAEARPARHSDTESPRGASYDQLVAEGDRLQNQGRSSVARERYQAALAQRPGGPEALVGLGHAALDAGDTALAIARFRQALSSSPRYADAYIGLGEAYGHNRAYRPSLQAFQRYLEINPSGTHAGMARRQIQALEERLRDSPGSEPSPPSSEP